MQWITRERPKVDRIACPWLIRKFIDPDAEFLFVPPAEVIPRAHATGAIPNDVEGVELSHVGPLCSFDALLAKYELADPVLQELAISVRGADMARLALAPQSAGLLAISHGPVAAPCQRSRTAGAGDGDLRALYAWLTRARSESHSRKTQRSPVTAASGR
jgi:hypothetical protein